MDFDVCGVLGEFGWDIEYIFEELLVGIGEGGVSGRL